MVSVSLSYTISRVGVIVILIPWIIAMILNISFEIALVVSIVCVAIYYILAWIFVLSKEKDFERLKKEK